MPILKLFKAVATVLLYCRNAFQPKEYHPPNTDHESVYNRQNLIFFYLTLTLNNHNLQMTLDVFGQL